MSGRAALWLERLGGAVLRRPWRVVAGAVVLAVLALLAAPSVRFSGDIARLLPADHQHLQLAELLDERARPSRVLWLLLEGDEAAAAVPEVAAELRESPFLREVAATRERFFGDAGPADAGLAFHLDEPTMQAIERRLSAEGRRDAVAELKEQLADDPIAGRELAVRDPLGLRSLLAAADPMRRFGFDPTSPWVVLRGSGAALLRLVGARDASDADFSTELMADLERRLAGRRWVAYGGYAVARAESRRMRNDLEGSSVWALGLAIGFLTLSMRSFLLPAIVMLPATVAILLAVPFASVLFGTLPAIAVAAAAVLIGLGDDFAIHWLAHYRELREAGAEHAAAVRGAHRDVGPELVIDALVTAGAFLTLAASELQGLLAFGLLLSIGLLLCLCSVLLVLPLLIARLGPRTGAQRSLLAAAADRLAERRSGLAIAVVTLVLAAACWGLLAARGVPLSADPLALRPPTDAQRQLRQRLEGELGFDTLPVLFLWGRDAPLDRLHEVLATMREEGRVAFAHGLSPAEVPAVRRRVAAFRQQVLPAIDAYREDLAAAGFDPEPFAPALVALRERFAADPEPPPPLVATFDGVPYRAVQVYATGSLAGEAFDAFAGAAEERGGGALRVYGTRRLERDLERVLRGDLLRTSLLALGLTVVLVTAFTRSWRYGSFALLPSAVGVSLTLGALALLDLPLSLASFMAVPLLVGIGVDEGVHVTGRLRQGERALGATGIAIVRSTVTTVLAFGALATVESPGLVGLGLVVAGGMAACLLASLFVLPPLLRWQLRRRPPAAVGPRSGAGNAAAGAAGEAGEAAP